MSDSVSDSLVMNDFTSERKCPYERQYIEFLKAKIDVHVYPLQDKFVDIDFPSILEYLQEEVERYGNGSHVHDKLRIDTALTLTDLIYIFSLDYEKDEVARGVAKHKKQPRHSKKSKKAKKAKKAKSKKAKKAKSKKAR